MPGVRYWFFRFRTRLASAGCLAASVCRHARWAGMLYCWLVQSPARCPCWWRCCCPLWRFPHFLRVHRGRPRAVAGLAMRAAWLRCPPVAPPLGRGLPTRAASRDSFCGPSDRGASAGTVVCAGYRPGSGLGSGRPGDDGSAGRAACPAGGAGAAGTPVRLVPWPAGPPGPLCWTSPELGDLRPRWGCGRGGARCRRAGCWWCRPGQRHVPATGGLGAARMLGPLSAGQVCHGVGGAPGGPVSLLPGWLPAGDGVWTRRVVFGVAGLGFLWGPGPGPCAVVRRQGVARVGCPAPPYAWGWAPLRSRQVTPGAPGSLWPRGVVVGVVELLVWTHALVRGSVARRPLMVPERP